MSVQNVRVCFPLVCSLHLVLALAAFGAEGQAVRADQSAVQAALNSYRAGDCAAAIPMLVAAANSSARVNLPLGKCYFERGSFADAVNPLKSYLTQYPSDSRAVILLAKVQERLNHLQEGIDVLDAFMRQHPEDPDVQAWIGRVYLDRGDESIAASNFNEVLKKAPDYPSALFGLALIAIRQQHWQEATNYLNRVTAIAPDQPDAYSALGDVYAQQGQCEKALGPYNQAFDLDPSGFPNAKSLAKCYAKLERWDEVARVLRSGTQAEADDPEATELVSRALQSNPQALEEYCQRVIALNSKNAVAHRLVAQNLYSSKQLDRAKTEYIEILKLEGDDPDPAINFRLGQMAESEEQIQEAHHYYEEAAKSKRSGPQMQLALARVDLALNDAPGAKAALGKVGPPESETDQYKTLLAETDLRMNLLDPASSLLSDLLARDPTNAKLLNLAAETASKQERYTDAINSLDKLLQLNPDSKKARYQLVALYTNHPELKGDQRSMELLKDFVSKQEQDPEGYLLLANLYRRNRDYESAKLYFDLGFEKMPNPVPARFAWAYVSRANMYYSQGHVEEALAQQLQATQLNPGDDRAQLGLGLIYVRLRNAGGVDQVLDRLEASSPELATQLQARARESGLAVKARAQ